MLIKAADVSKIGTSSPLSRSAKPSSSNALGRVSLPLIPSLFSRIAMSISSCANLSLVALEIGVEACKVLLAILGFAACLSFVAGRIEAVFDLDVFFSNAAVLAEDDESSISLCVVDWLVASCL